jgi:signal transduction histidine kinase
VTLRSSAVEDSTARRIVAALRAAVAVACLEAVLWAPVRLNWAVVTVSCLFAAYSLAGLVGRWEGLPGAALLGLVLQTIFFLVFAAFGPGSRVFLASALYFHLMLMTMLLHPWWDTCIVAALSTAFLVLVDPAPAGPLQSVVIWLGLLASVAALARERTERSFRESLQQARDARVMAASARDAERHKLAGDFHDGPLQAFTGIQLRLEVLRKTLEKKPGAVAEELRSVQELARSQTVAMRAFLRGIRPVEVGEAGLVSSLRQAVADFQKHTGTAAAFESHGSPDTGSEESSAEMVQIVQEALNNIQKHSRATKIVVAVRGDARHVEVSIADNGMGFPFSGTYTLDELEQLRRGPFSIERRVRSLGGKLILESRPQRGSTLTVQVSS